MDIVTLAAARKGGGSGGDVTKQYVDEHLALKADKIETAEYPIASTTTGVNPTITDSADGLIQDVKVYGRSRVSKNLLNYNSFTSGGIDTVTVTQLPEKYAYSVVGTASRAAINVWLKGSYSGSGGEIFTLAAGDYYIRDVSLFVPNAEATGTKIGETKKVTLQNEMTITGIRAPSAVIDTTYDTIIYPMLCTAEAYEADPTFEPYGIISIGDGGEVDVLTCGKNLFNKDSTGNHLNKRISGMNGNLWDSTGWTASYNIPVVPGRTYTFTTGTTDVSYNCQFDKNGRRVTGGNLLSGVPLTISDNVSYIIFDFPTANLDLVQMEVGSSATTYEPYISTSAFLTTGLPYCGIPVTSGETYTDGDGVKWLADTADVEGVTKRCCKVTFDGSVDENWERYTVGSAGNYAMKIQIDNIIEGAIPAYLLLCNSLTPIPTNSTWGNYDYFISKDSEKNIVTGIRSITTVEDWRTYLASNPVTVVYKIAEPYEISLTTEEQQALLALRTFDSTTNVTVTDDPFVDISYIKNTNNGKAAEQLADNLRASIGWIFSVPEMHRNILRGKYLGSVVSAAQLAAIADGSFDDLYVGDYWTINNTVYRIADMDFFRTDANSPFLFTTHHLVIVPDGTMYKAKMNDSSASTSGGYKNSDMRTTNLATAKTTINADFPDMVLTYKDLLVTATSSGAPTASDYFDCDIELMSETMLYGGYVNAKPSNPPYFCASTNPTQFALFKLNPQFIITDKSETIWLRDAADSSRFCTMEYSPFGRDANYADGAVRPFFLIGDAT